MRVMETELDEKSKLYGDQENKIYDLEEKVEELKGKLKDDPNKLSESEYCYCPLTEIVNLLLKFQYLISFIFASFFGFQYWKAALRN